MAPTLWVAFLLYLLHQDFWFWGAARPLVFGVFPIGLAYHAAYTLAIASVLAWLVRAYWPSHLEGHLDDHLKDRE